MPDDLPPAHEKTLAFYDANGQAYVDATWGLDLTELYRPFERRLPAGGRVLDAGSGSGRDTLHFLRAGYEVTAFDASEAMVRASTARTGQRTLRLRFDEVAFEREFDGVWACASLLHVPAARAIDAHARLARALRPGGVLFASYKYGRGEREESGRLFTDYDEEAVAALATIVPGLVLEDVWLTEDLRPKQRGDRWANAIFRSVGCD